eukprot:3542154-Rhodomonas_salina.1
MPPQSHTTHRTASDFGAFCQLSAPLIAYQVHHSPRPDATVPSIAQQIGVDANTTRSISTAHAKNILRPSEKFTGHRGSRTMNSDKSSGSAGHHHALPRQHRRRTRGSVASNTGSAAVEDGGGFTAKGSNASRYSGSATRNRQRSVGESSRSSAAAQTEAGCTDTGQWPADCLHCKQIQETAFLVGCEVPAPRQKKLKPRSSTFCRNTCIAPQSTSVPSQSLYAYHHENYLHIPSFAQDPETLKRAHSLESVGRIGVRRHYQTTETDTGYLDRYQPT